MPDPAPPTELLGALLRLRQGLVDHPVSPLTPDAEEAERQRGSLVQQLDDYVLPRLVQVDAPLLAVVGGSTGAGKSTLVNALVGSPVSTSGVIRPTTRSPVLVHHPADAEWFGVDRLLPQLERTDRPSADQGQLQLVPTDAVPAGLAILDAPDIDSVERRNRELAAQLLAAADLWLFVTSAARYADQVPWDFLATAVDRSTAVAVVLDRVAPEAAREVSSHLDRMLQTRGLQDARLFQVVESPLDDEGLLPPGAVHEVRAWLDDLARDADARAAVVRKTLDGAIASIPGRSRVVAAALRHQAEVIAELARAVDSAYDETLATIDAATQDGTLLRGEVLARWQEFVGTGEFFKSLEERVGRFRNRLWRMVKGHPRPEQRIQVAVESGMETLIVEHAESAAERAARAWRSHPAGNRLLGTGPDDIGRASRGLREAAARTVRDWQGGVLDLVRREGAGRRTTARFLAYGVNGLGVALMMVIFVQTAGLTGAEVGVAGGTAVVAQRILEAVFGDQAVRRLVQQARQDLHERVEALWASERDRYHTLLHGYPASDEAAEAVLDLTRKVEDIRLLGDIR